jgi:hypothetical protein
MSSRNPTNEPAHGEEPAPRSQMTPEQRRRRARIAAHASWAKTADRTARTSSGTKAFLARFERQVDPDGQLPQETREVGRPLGGKPEPARPLLDGSHVYTAMVIDAGSAYAAGAENLREPPRGRQ